MGFSDAPFALLSDFCDYVIHGWSLVKLKQLNYIILEQDWKRLKKSLVNNQWGAHTLITLVRVPILRQKWLKFGTINRVIRVNLKVRQLIVNKGLKKVILDLA